MKIINILNFELKKRASVELQERVSYQIWFYEYNSHNNKKIKIVASYGIFKRSLKTGHSDRPHLMTKIVSYCFNY